MIAIIMICTDMLSCITIIMMMLSSYMITYGSAANTTSTLAPIMIGVSIDVNGRVTQESAELLRGYYIWERWVNTHQGGIMYHGEQRGVQLVVMDDQGDTSRMMINYGILCHSVNVTLAPFSSTNTLLASNITSSCDMFMVSSGASSPAVFARGLPYLFSPLVLLDEFFLDIVEGLVASGTTQFVSIQSDDSFCVAANYYFTA